MRRKSDAVLGMSESEQNAFADRVSGRGNAIGRVRLPVHFE